MVKEVSSSGIILWNDKESGCGGFSISDDFENSIISSENNDFRPDSKRFKLMGSHDNQQQELGVLNLYMESPSLGLSLRKTPSFVELIEAKLCKQRGTSSKTITGAESTDCARPKRKKVEGKLKAASFDAKLLKIGSWERHAIRELDLVAKCYYAKRKLVWEMLDNGLKSKIEVQWADISAIRATFRKNKTAVLEIELKNVPLFSREVNPQPRRHTNWQPSADFTGGQAPKYRRHYIEFEEGIFRSHYERILQCDKRLFMLSQQPFPSDRSPYFNLDMSGFREFSFEYSRPQPQYSSMMQFPQYVNPYVPFHQAQKFEPTPRLPITSYNNLASPISVMEFSPVEGHGRNHSFGFRSTLNCGGNVKVRNDYMARGEHALLGHPVSLQCPVFSGNRLPRPLSSNSLLKDMADQLLNAPVPSTCADEQRLMARVNSMHNLLEVSTVQQPINDANTSNIEHSHSTNNSSSTSSWSTDESYGNGGLMPQESVNWLPTAEMKSSSLEHQRIPSFSNLFSDPAFAAIAAELN
ncbi:hypothetical protein AQUCO_00300558v1 [Aquilegia coerulea]|uniref:TRF2/HOY1 PH-like domain-containing protein n=1 Tax=Aquilegia coerulea TaxID=218851 RepID=A0A2G5EZB7_AQUCA|nr:hypothetical protein AQUCO_00300558v1 [Aquilegia coerulea]